MKQSILLCALIISASLCGNNPPAVTYVNKFVPTITFPSKRSLIASLNRQGFGPVSNDMANIFGGKTFSLEQACMKAFYMSLITLTLLKQQILDTTYRGSFPSETVKAWLQQPQNSPSMLAHALFEYNTQAQTILFKIQDICSATHYYHVELPARL